MKEGGECARARTSEQARTNGPCSLLFSLSTHRSSPLRCGPRPFGVDPLSPPRKPPRVRGEALPRGCDGGGKGRRRALHHHAPAAMPATARPPARPAANAVEGGRVEVEDVSPLPAPPPGAGAGGGIEGERNEMFVAPHHCRKPSSKKSAVAALSQFAGTLVIMPVSLCTVQLSPPAGARPLSRGLPSRRRHPSKSAHASAAPSRRVLPPLPPADPAPAQPQPTTFIVASIVATALLGLAVGRRG